MKVVVKEVGKEPCVKEIENTLEAMQAIVGGYIETPSIGGNILMVCNEEGKLKGLPRNFLLAGDVIVGNVFFCSVGDTDFESLSDTAVDVLLTFFKKGVWYK